MLRPKFKEPRIHFAVNCASIGCPALLEEAFTPAKLEKQLEAASKRFLMDRTRNRYDLKKKKLYLSKIFKWFDDDFEVVVVDKKTKKKKKRTVAQFVSSRITENKKEQAIIANDSDFDIDYLDYDWNLNIQKPKKKIKL